MPLKSLLPLLLSALFLSTLHAEDYGHVRVVSVVNAETPTRLQIGETKVWEKSGGLPCGRSTPAFSVPVGEHNFSAQNDKCEGAQIRVKIKKNQTLALIAYDVWKKKSDGTLVREIKLVQLPSPSAKQKSITVVSFVPKSITIAIDGKLHTLAPRKLVVQSYPEDAEGGVIQNKEKNKDFAYVSFEDMDHQAALLYYDREKKEIKTYSFSHSPY